MEKVDGDIELYDGNDVAMPCGLKAKYFFDDIFELYDSDGESILINEDNISWDYD